MSAIEYKSKPVLGSLTGQLLIATPMVMGSCFARSLIYLCSHNENGAMGMIINLPMPSITDRDIYDQLNIPYLNGVPALPVYFGGPVETSRGFVLYCGEPLEEETIASNEGVILSSNVRLLRDIAVGGGPQHRILGLGYAGWAAGQLESEIESGSWICVPSTKHLIFETNNEDKWALAAQSIGVDMLRYSPHAGHA